MRCIYERGSAPLINIFPLSLEGEGDKETLVKSIILWGQIEGLRLIDNVYTGWDEVAWL